MISNEISNVYSQSFAKRLLKDVPIQDNDSNSCGDKCSNKDPKSNCKHSVINDICTGSHDHSKERELFERSTPEKYSACTLLREEAKKAFAAKEYKLAGNLYERILVQLDYTFPEDDVYRAKFREMELSTHQNLALTRFRLGDYRKSISHCNRVLSLEDTNVKALVRRGMSYQSLFSFAEAEKDFNRALEIDSHCATAKEQLRLLELQRQKANVTEKVLYSAMFD